MSKALEGVRVLELGGREVSLAGRILADLGAEVLLLEPPAGAPIRHDAPFLDDESGIERGFGHLYFNANKYSVVVDPAVEQDGFLQLIASADVLLDAAGAGVLDGLGLTHEHLRSYNAGLIQCSVTPFGRDVPWSQWQANDLVAGAAGGLVFVSGEPRGVPVQGGADPSYTMTSLAAASAVTIALHQRDFGDSEGRAGGVHIDLSMQEATALAVMQTCSPSQWQWYSRIPRRPGLSAAMACKDGKYVGLLVRPDRFRSYLDWAEEVGIDHGMTMDDWHWARIDAPRMDNPVSATTLALAAALTRDEFVAGALKADIVCLPVLDFPDLEQHEQYQVNEQFLTVQHEPLDRALGFVRSPADAMADGVDIRRAPTLGEHQALLDELPELRREMPGAAVAAHRPEQALSGLRVVDFGWVLAAPIGTRILASFGAEVIRVESSTKPDSMRSQLGPDGKPHPDMGGLYNVVNAGKKSLTVDLSKPGGMQLVKDLIATADIVVNNFRPGALERMGLGFDVLRGLRDDIILLNLPGAHRKGPWAQRASMGNILMAASGFNMLTGFEGERPRGIGIAYPDFTSPHLLAATVLAAIRQRETTGQGQELHLTQLSGVLALLGAQWMQFKATGQQPPRNGNRNPNFCPHGVYRTRDEGDPPVDCWLALAIRTDAQWSALCTLMDRSDLASDPALASVAARRVREDEVDAAVSAWAADRDRWQLAEALQAAGIPAAPVENLADMLDRDPQLHRHYLQVQQPCDPDVDIPVDREAARWVGQQHDLNRAPMLGEHNEQVVRELLGRDEEAFVQLLVDEVLT